MTPQVSWRPLRIIRDTRGEIRHYLKADSPEFRGFGEAYFSVVLPGVVKAWKLHRRTSQNLVCVAGAAKFVVYDHREDSPEFGKRMEFICDDGERHGLLHIPPGFVYGFGCQSPSSCILANVIDQPHSPDESQGFALDHAGFRWD